MSYSSGNSESHLCCSSLLLVVLRPLVDPPLLPSMKEYLSCCNCLDYVHCQSTILLIYMWNTFESILYWTGSTSAQIHEPLSPWSTEKKAETCPNWEICFKLRGSLFSFPKFNSNSFFCIWRPFSFLFCCMKMRTSWWTSVLFSLLKNKVLPVFLASWSFFTQGVLFSKWLGILCFSWILSKHPLILLSTGSRQW